MSTLHVEAVEITDIRPHPNADRLVLVLAKGFQIVSGKDNDYSVGDIVVHIPPDAMLTKKWADEWKVTPYLAWRKSEEKGQVKAAKIRGEVSYGFLIPNEFEAKLGEDLKERYDISKYEPPETHSAGDRLPEHPLFHRYTEIENGENYPDLFVVGEEVVATEKLHGTNSRVGVVVEMDSGTMSTLIGTHATQIGVTSESLYSYPLNQYFDKFEKLWELAQFNIGDTPIQSVVVFGEIFGGKVQDLAYGIKRGKYEYRIFDIAVNRIYMDFDQFELICQALDLPMVPVLYRGAYDLAKMQELATGKTTINDGPHMREGIVVKPVKERRAARPGRVILKFKSPDYITRKGGTEFK